MRKALAMVVLTPIILGACGDGSRGRDNRDRDAGNDSVAGGSGSPPQTAEAPRRGTVPIEIVAVIGGKEIKVTGAGECEHSADASIYERPAKVWTARYQGSERDPIQYSNLNVWRENAGPVGFNVSILVGENRHDIATVQGGEIRGSGTASLSDVGGGRLSVEGKTEKGTPLRLRVTCERFTELVAEGG